MTKFEKLLVTEQKVFTTNDLAILWQMPDRKQLWSLIRYYLRKKKLQRIYSGTYAIDDNFSNLELAVNLFAPAYVSYLTALGIHGINWQLQAQTHVMAAVSKTITLQNKMTVVAHQVKNYILLNSLGLEKHVGYYLASPERAICDTLYLHPGFVFDNLNAIQSNVLMQVVEIYQNKALTKRVREICQSLEQKGQADA